MTNRLPFVTGSVKFWRTKTSSWWTPSVTERTLIDLKTVFSMVHHHTPSAKATEASLQPCRRRIDKRTFKCSNFQPTSEAQLVKSSYRTNSTRHKQMPTPIKCWTRGQQLPLITNKRSRVNITGSFSSNWTMISLRRPPLTRLRGKMMSIRPHAWMSLTACSTKTGSIRKTEPSSCTSKTSMLRLEAVKRWKLTVTWLMSKKKWTRMTCLPGRDTITISTQWSQAIRPTKRFLK